ncbi:hypothetical protein [Halobellus marinus]|uniref:hypothetical protein n=1 Tax=Halobellus TaxID=1073986 RepID=UPI0028A8F6FD|nr:hypothetical protein [Halobellus sp. DFY28]
MVLVLCQMALFPVFAVQPVNPDAWVLPDEEEFLEAPQEYLGDRVETQGIVRETAPIVIHTRTTSGTHRVTILRTSIDPDRGDKIRVYGTPTAPNTIQATNAFVVPPRGRWYAWGISFLAGLWVLARLIRQWTVDRSTLGFQPREEPLSVTELIRTDREESDA